MGRLTPVPPRVRVPEASAASGRNLTHTRRAARPQSSTLYVGLDVQQASLAVASVAQDHHAEVVYLGTVGPRHYDLDQLIRTGPSKATQLVCVDVAGPCGDWRALSAQPRL
jgi:hypothetical protein